MTVKITGKKTAKKKRINTHVRPEAPHVPAGARGWWRLRHVIAYYGISASEYYKGVKLGRYRKPDAYRGRIPVWKSQDF